MWTRFFAFTFITEALVAYPLLKPVEKSPGRRIGAIAIANFVTHPLVFFFIAKVIHDRATMTLVAESWAVLAETFVYALIFPALGNLRAFAVSALANGVSFVLGSVATHLHLLR